MGSKILNENVINVLFVDKQMQISKENITSGFKMAANLLNSVILMFIHFFFMGTQYFGHFIYIMMFLYVQSI